MEKEVKETQSRTAAAPVRPAYDQIDLKELMYVVLVRWKLLVLAGILCMALAGAFHQLVIKPSYEADASIFITNTDSVITISDMQLSSALTEDYAKILKSRSVLKEVIKDQGLDMTYRDLAGIVTITNPDSSHIINIKVSCGDADMARNIVNSLMNVGVRRIYEVIGTGEPNVIDYSEADTVVETTPGLLGYLAKGAVIGVMLMCMLICTRFLLDTTMKTEEDITKYLKMPVLAVVPYYKEGKE